LATSTRGSKRPLWAAIRALDERTQLLSKLARDAEASSLTRPASSYTERAQASLEHARTLREILFRTPSPNQAATAGSQHP
jgi:hypothetical protein